jgi:hypothetical protein
MKQLLLLVLLILPLFAYTTDSKTTIVVNKDNIIDKTSYTTKVLEPNFIGGKNVLTQEMINGRNTKYIIKYEYDLRGKTITIQENCILEFEGGRLTNGIVDFTNLQSPQVYSSWMDTQTLLNSVQYMSYKTLIIDNVLTLDRPISNNGSNNNLKFFTISGLETNIHKWDDGNSKGHSRIICNNCSAIDISGWCNVVKDLSFSFSSGGLDNPFIILETQGQAVSDLDAVVDNCFFNTDDHTIINAFADIKISNAIVSYGRGLTVQNCLFNGPVKDAYVKCLMKKDGWRLNPGIDVSDKYGGRAFWFHHNRIHMNIARFVHFAVNERDPNCVFRGIRIENNIADVGGSLGRFDAPSYNTVITNNTFIGGVHPSLDFLSFTDANELKIENNVFRSFDNNDLQKSVIRANYSICIHSGKNDEITNVSVCNNLVSCGSYFIFADSRLNGLIVSANIFNDQSFTAENCAILRSLKSSKNVIITNNINSSISKAEVEIYKAFDTAFPNENLENVTIGDNIGCINWITSFGEYDRFLKGRTFTNINIKYDKTVCPDEIMDKSSLLINVKNNIGFTYVDCSLNPVRSIIWNGSKWIEQDGASMGVNRSGAFSQKPSGKDIYEGFQYWCTDKQTIEGNAKGILIYWNGTNWVDALGRTVK